ncbi:5-formyltetrahydrofolate cyclo-ligase [Streptomyces sp. SID3343]|uniref:5-formyltetrahydrofolate cyclo-ligase n=1 Tax=Streptomyces sp. SID3343 TaxID=2690260 RepID=UPI00136DC879|nr:5-formyltetrahydrofolate cyclo-ligase [Streptomyces sp. SID3343]MYV97374.1 5-formyltetrahydrofolate cyclo-ligase [Streptomyces sp. SID3343]
MKDILNDKATLRSHLLHARSQLGIEERASAGRVLSGALLALPEVRAAGTIAAYVPVGSEPGPRELAEELSRGPARRVLLPVLLADNDLDWALYEGPQSLVRATRGLREPVGRRVGPDAVGAADVLVVPGLAVDGRGLRLGRGGGSYDRALARVGSSAVTIVLLYDGEVLDHVPAEPHDRPVDIAVTPAAVHRFGR